MKIAVLGATGGTGQQFVSQALANDHHITALVRSPQKWTIEHPQLEIVAGDALNPADVRRAVSGQDAVLCALGNGSNTGKMMTRRDGTQHIVSALAELGEQPHLVVVSSMGVGESKKQVPFMVRAIIMVILRNPLADHEAQEAVVTGSALPWTILRPTALNEGPLTRSLQVSQPPQPIQSQPPISKADVAWFALKTIEERSHLRQALTLTASRAAQ